MDRTEALRIARHARKGVPALRADAFAFADDDAYALWGDAGVYAQRYAYRWDARRGAYRITFVGARLGAYGALRFIAARPFDAARERDCQASRRVAHTRQPRRAAHTTPALHNARRIAQRVQRIADAFDAQRASRTGDAYAFDGVAWCAPKRDVSHVALSAATRDAMASLARIGTSDARRAQRAADIAALDARIAARD